MIGDEPANDNQDRNYRRSEPTAQRLDRNFNELLQELRVAQAAVQILFGFLLSMAFQARFVDLTGFQKDFYLGTLSTSALSVIFLTGGVAAHRLLFRRGVKDFIVKYTAVMAAIGMTLMALTVVGGVILVIDVVDGRGLAIAIGGSIAAVCVTVWLVIPGVIRLRSPDPDPDLEDAGAASSP